MPVDQEKPYTATDSSDGETVLVECPAHTTEAKILRRIDWHVVPCLCILYLLAFIDRVNVANSRAFGLEADLGLDLDKYNVVLTIFFVRKSSPHTQSSEAAS